MTKVATVQDSIQKTISTLTNGSTTVVFEGVGYSASPKADGGYQIKMASIAEGASPAFVRALDGYTAHEVAHVLYSDFKGLHTYDPILKAFINIVEDFRIEVKMASVYEGTKAKLDFCNLTVIDRLDAKFGSEVEINWANIQLATLISLFGYTNQMESVFLAELATKIETALPHLFNQARAANTASEVLVVSKDLKEALEKLFTMPEEDQQDPDQGFEQDKQNEEAKEQGDSSDSDSSDSDDSDSSDSDSSDSDDSDSSDSDSSDSDDSDSSDSEDATPSESALDQAKVNLNGSKCLSDDFRQQVMSDLSTDQYGSIADLKSPRPFTRRLDTVMPTNKVLGNTPVDSRAKVTAIKLASVLRSRTYTSCERGLSRGKLDNQGLYRAATDFKVFKQKHDPEVNLDICFVVGVDVSSSMDRNVALEMMRNAFDVLTALNVPFEVFTYTSDSLAGSQYPSRLDTSVYTRLSALRIGSVKTFEQPAAIRRSHISVGRQGNTPTPEAFEHAEALLKGRKEQKKVFINITDGMPSDYGLDPIKAMGLLKNQMASFKSKGLRYINLGYNVGRDFLKIDANAVLTDSCSFFKDFADSVKKTVLY